MLVFLDFDGDGLVVAKIGDSEDGKGTQAHDREDVREDCDGVDEFVHCEDRVSYFLKKVNLLNLLFFSTNCPGRRYLTT